MTATPAPPLVSEIAAAARAAGGRALVVGGWVRDRLRGQPSKDVDVEVFGIAEDRLRALLAPLGRVEPVRARLARVAAAAWSSFAIVLSPAWCVASTLTRPDPPGITPG